MADSLHPHRTRGYDKSRHHKFSSSHKRSSTQWYGYSGNSRPRTESHAVGQSLKFRTDTVLNLNTADTSLLQRVPGIGPYWARRIVDYRNRLGGFVHPNQLDEIDSSLIPCRRWFHVPSPSCSRLAVNRAAFRTLLRHPYLNYQQVCQLMDYRRRHGSLSSLSTLLMLPAFSAADTLRLKPYLSFE